jgi:oxygen-independent coproporphyrinogen III oxidase
VGAGLPAPCSREELPLRMVMAETMMLGLRLMEGIDRREFARRFGLEVTEAFPASLRRHLDLGSLELSESHVRIARGSLFVSDAVLADIIEEAKTAEH